MRETCGVERDVFDTARIAIENLLDKNFATIGGIGQASRQVEDVGQRGFAFQLVNRRRVDLASDGNLRTDGGKVEHVFGLQQDVVRLVALDEEIVEIEFGDDFGSALQLNATH